MINKMILSCIIFYFTKFQLVLLLDECLKIIDKLIKDLETRLINKSVKINLTDNAKKVILEQGYDINYGARPLKRFISANIETLIAKKMIEGNIKYGDIITIDSVNDKLIYSLK